MNRGPFDADGTPKRTPARGYGFRFRWPLFVWLAAVAIAVVLVLRDHRAETFSGVVEVHHENISPHETARLETLHVQEGQRVRKDDLLAEFDTSILEAEMAIYRRLIDLEDPASSERLRHLEIRLEGYILRAPSDGVISRVFRQPGGVAAGGQPVLRFVADGDGRIAGFLPEHLVGAVSVGDEAYVESINRAAGPVRATVTALGPEIFALPERASLVRGEPVRGRRLVLIPDEGHGLLPGETVSIQLR